MLSNEEVTSLKRLLKDSTKKRRTVQIKPNEAAYLVSLMEKENTIVIRQNIGQSQAHVFEGNATESQ